MVQPSIFDTDVLEGTDPEPESGGAAGWLRFPPNPQSPLVALWSNENKTPLICNITEESHTGIGLLVDEGCPFSPGEKVSVTSAQERRPLPQNAAIVQYVCPQKDGTTRVGCEWLEYLLPQLA